MTTSIGPALDWVDPQRLAEAWAFVLGYANLGADS